VEQVNGQIRTFVKDSDAVRREMIDVMDSAEEQPVLIDEDDEPRTMRKDLPVINVRLVKENNDTQEKTHQGDTNPSEKILQLTRAFAAFTLDSTREDSAPEGLMNEAEELKPVGGVSSEEIESEELTALREEVGWIISEDEWMELSRRYG
jgi:hypothetical protein